MKKQQETILIKKYGNRRLYNTQISSYINLKDLFDLIKSGQDFRVVEVATGKDITKICLIQVLFEKEEGGNDLLPVDSLKFILSLYGSENSTHFPAFLSQAMNYFNNLKQEHGNETGEGASYNPLNFFGDLTKKNLEIFEKSFSMFYNAEREKERSDS